ncbi:hypothetical protein [Inquilinus limosus]|uniref:hypothetical protein n=1 Tax=Inquilinus limosus TaxID=171674 RepID=UPI0004256E69|nr:hypothetical protein [Inquilinus limosus]
MKHRRGPFGEDLRAAFRPDSADPHLLISAMKARREEVIWGARDQGMSDEEIDALLRGGIEAAERRIFGDTGKGRRRPR